MKNSDGKSDAAILRQKAEEQLKKKAAQTVSKLSEVEMLKLVYEMEVHQIELEMQNEELILANERAEDAANKYTTLYDFAPTGYFTFSKEGNIGELNITASQMLGKERVHLVNSRFGLFVSDDTRSTFNGFLEKIFISKAKERCDVTITTNDNPPIFVHLTGIVSENGEQCYITAVDITERKHSEEQIKKLLSEKELLLHEVHHRIKNNMNIIMSLLSLQADTLEGSPAEIALRDASNRMRSMLVLYEMLYRSEQFGEISVQEYCIQLCDGIRDNHPSRATVELIKEIDDFMLDAKLLSPLGMILNELLTNTMKYAFVGRDRGSITVSASMKDKHSTVVVQDDGVGIPESVDIGSSLGFGLQLVDMLTKQLDGTIRIERGSGTKFVLEFDV